MSADIIDFEEWKKSRETPDDVEDIQDEFDELLSKFRPHIIPTVWGIPLYDKATSDWHSFINYQSPFSDDVAEHPGSHREAVELLTRGMLMLDHAGHEDLADIVSSVINKLLHGEE